MHYEWWKVAATPEKIRLAGSGFAEKVALVVIGINESPLRDYAYLSELLRNPRHAKDRHGAGLFAATLGRLSLRCSMGVVNSMLGTACRENHDDVDRGNEANAPRARRLRFRRSENRSARIPAHDTDRHRSRGRRRRNRTLEFQPKRSAPRIRWPGFVRYGLCNYGLCSQEQSLQPGSVRLIPRLICEARVAQSLVSARAFLYQAGRILSDRASQHLLAG